MTVTALKAAGDGRCSTPVQIRALLFCNEEEGSYVALLAWTLAFLCAIVEAGENLLLDASGNCWNPFVPQAVAGENTPLGWKLLASPSPSSVGAHSGRS